MADTIQLDNANSQTDTTATEEQQTKTPEVVTRPTKKMHILVCYDTSDGKIIRSLDEDLQLMYRRLGSQVNRHYFGYQTIKAPTLYTGDSQYLKDKYQEEKAEYDKNIKLYHGRHDSMIRFLQQEKLLLILCTSNTFMEHLWEDMDQNPKLGSLLTNPTYRITKVAIRPVAGETSSCEPLCAYDGIALETACQQITTTIETIARDYFGPELEAEITTPFSLLTSPTTIHVSVPSKSNQTTEILTELLGPIQAIVEQTNTRIVESQQLAIAERSQRESIQESEAELRRQMEAMKQQLATIQNASIFAKIGRLFKTSPSN